MVRNLVVRARSAIVLMGILTLVLAAPAAHADDALSFALADSGPLGGLSIGDFNPGTLARGSIEAQTAGLRMPVLGVGLALSTGGDSDCGISGTASQVVTGPNVDLGSDLFRNDVGCQFAAELTLTGERGPVTVTGQCDSWHQDLSYCWIDGDAGQFWLRRKTTEATTIDVILGEFAVTDTLSLGHFGPGDDAQGSGDAKHPPSQAALPIKPDDGDGTKASIPTRGIMLEGIEDDAGRPVADEWLLLPAGVVMLRFQR